MTDTTTDTDTRGIGRPPFKLRAADVAAGVGLLLWFIGLSRVDITFIGGLGLIDSLTWPCFLGLVVFLVAFTTEVLRDDRDNRRLGAYLVGLVVMLMGLPSFLEDTASVPTGWLHAGFSEYILRHGDTMASYDARFEWPGMFSFSALAAVAGGASNVIAFMRWTPLVLNLLYLLPLRIIVKNLARDERVQWLAMAVFVMANWLEQDYFSPQGLAYLGFLTVVAVLLASRTTESPLLTPTGWSRYRAALHTARVRLFRAGPTFDQPDGRTRAGVFGLIVVLMAGIVVSHQITPYALLLDLVLLALWDRLGSRVLIVVLGVLSIGYLSIGAEQFWSAHFQALVGGGSLNDALVARTQVSGEHLVVVQSRVIYSVGLLFVGAIGAWLRKRRPDTTLLVPALAFAPFGLVLVQTYGGEVLIRTLLFSLPFLSVLIAEVVVAIVGRARVVGKVVLATGLVMASLVLLLTRYGNEPFYRTTSDDVAAVNAVMDGAPQGTNIAVLAQNLPWRFRDIERFKFISIEFMCGSDFTIECVQRQKIDYLIVTEGQRRYAEVVGGFSREEVTSLENSLVTQGGYRVGASLGEDRIYISPTASDLNLRSGKP